MSRTPSQVTILLAEDDVYVRTLVEALLTREGYDVLTAENGIEALGVVGATVKCIDLLLTDVNMPLMDGAVLAENVRRLRPETKVVVMSGQFDVQSLQSGTLDAFLSKPFLPKALLQTVANVLN